MRIALAILMLSFSLSAASITGTVVDVTGARIPHAVVALQSDAITIEVQTDGRGVYEFSNLPGADYTLTISMLGFQRFTLKAVELSEREQKRIPEIALDVASSGCSGPIPPAFRLLAGETVFGGLAGSVIGNGKGMEGVEVTLVCRTFSACASTKTDAKGLFSFRMLSPGEYGLSFRRAAYYPDPAVGYAYRVKAGLESEYPAREMERCPNGNCDPKLRPPKQLTVCE